MVLQATVNWGLSAGLLGGTHKVGVVVGDRASDQDALHKYLLPDLQRAGVTPVVETLPSQPTETAATNAAAPLVVQKLKADGADSIFPLIPFNSFFPLVNAMQQQSYYPKLLLSDYEEGIESSLGLIPTVDEAVLNGQEGVTTETLGGVDDTEAREPGRLRPRPAYLLRRLAQGVPAARGQGPDVHTEVPNSAGQNVKEHIVNQKNAYIEEQGPVQGWCTAIRLFATAARNAGSDLNRRTFVEAMSKIKNFPGGVSPVLSYGPNKFYGPTPVPGGGAPQQHTDLLGLRPPFDRPPAGHLLGGEAELGAVANRLRKYVDPTSLDRRNGEYFAGAGGCERTRSRHVARKGCVVHNIGANSPRRGGGGRRPTGGLRRALAAATLAATAVAVVGGVGGAVATAAGASGSKVLLVGTYHGHAGQYSTIQAAVDAAKPGDWILVAPGDYHEDDDAKGPSKAQASEGDYGGVVVTTSDLHIRGMDRSTVVVDGTKAGSPSCASTKKDQDFGANSAGRNGIVVYKANDVWVQNLTVCNFLSGHGSSGNEVWWNGVPTTGPIGLHGYWGTYLTATSTYFGGESTAAAYGIFSSNASGGEWNHVYASNMNDSGSYIGACKQHMHSHHRQFVVRVQRPGLLGDELRRPDHHRELEVRPQPGRRRHQLRRLRRPAGPPDRALPKRRHLQDHPYPLVLGLLPQRLGEQQHR